MIDEQNLAKRISWEEVAPYENLIFGIWATKGPNKWVERAWHALGKAGLTEYKDDSEKQFVYLRLMTLATMYHEFFVLASEMFFERKDDTYEWVINDYIVNKMRLWELDEIQKRYREVKDDYDDPDECLTFIICDIIDDLRDHVYKALIHEYLYDWKLFEDMLNSRYSQECFGEQQNHEWQDIEEENLSMNEERAFYWVSIGMPRSPEENV